VGFFLSDVRLHLALAYCFNKKLQFIGFAASLKLYPPVCEVAHPTGNVEAASQLADTITEAHTLHAALIKNLNTSHPLAIGVRTEQSLKKFSLFPQPVLRLNVLEFFHPNSPANMPSYIEMPKLADTMTEGTLVKWRKQPGDKVAMGDVVAEVETDKATMEMESFEDGIIHELLVQVGQKVPIGSRIAMVLSKGEKPPAPGSVPSPASSVKNAAPTAPTSAAACATGHAVSGSPEVTHLALGTRLKSSPLARKLAKERGANLASLQGTGPGGRIIAKDVLQAKSGVQTVVAPVVQSVAPASVPVLAAGAGDQVIPLSGMRRIIAERLLLSKTTIPHFYLHIEVDAAPMMKMRAELNAGVDPEKGIKLTVNDFVLKAVVAAAVKVPTVNAAFDGDSILQFGSVGLSVAVAVDDGLVTPVVRDAHSKSLVALSLAVKDLATRARSKKLKPDEYQGGTITVSNLGAYGIEFFDAIINPPQAIIVSVGAIVKKAVVGANDTIVAGQRLAIGLSADHRVVDGAVGAQYLAELRRLLESPALLLV